MNKETAVMRINKIGYIAGVFNLIAKILLGVGAGGCLLWIIAALFIPSKAITYNVEGVIHGYVDIKKLTGEDMTDEILDRISDELAVRSEGKVEVNGFEYGDVNCDVTSDGVIVMNAKGSTSRTDVKRTTIMLLGMGLLYCALAFVSLLFLGFLLKELSKCASPFDEKIIKGLKMFAYSLIPWVLIKTVKESVTATVFYGKGNINFNIDITMIVVVLIILALAYIFSYGAVLQQESDETL